MTYQQRPGGARWHVRLYLSSQLTCPGTEDSKKYKSGTETLQRSQF